MKKTLTVNLGGTVFNIDDDAYRLLDNYLSNLKMHFRKEAGADEIVDDIERRISELFAEKLSAGSQVITIADVEEVIARMESRKIWRQKERVLVPIPAARVPGAAMVPVLGTAIPLMALHAVVYTAIRMTKCWVVSSVEWLPTWDGM